MPKKFTDDLDRAIVRLLETDGRLSNMEIARRLGVSESSVRKRIARLMEQHGLRVVAALDGPLGGSRFGGTAPWAESHEHATARLVEPGGHRASADQDTVARTTEMLFLIHAEAGRRLAVADYLAAFPEVQQVALTTGSYDIVVRAVFRSDAAALDFLVQRVEGAEGVRSVQASHVLKNLLPTPRGSLPSSAASTGMPQTALDAFVVEAARAADLDAVLGLACDTALTSLGVDRVSIWSVEEPDGPPVYRASRGLSVEYLDAIRERASPRIGVGPRVLGAHVHVYVEDAHTDPLMAEVQDLVRREGYRSMLFLPLLYGEQLIGLIGLYNDAIRGYSDDEIALAQAFADQLAIALVRTGARAATQAGEESPAEL
jgi:Lrp/AsnC family transcriptional regulator for asnA, asnC and gidA